MIDKTKRPILVTGCYRSGTTVVEKILNMHTSVTLASQPFPILYFVFKERFNQSLGIQRRYSLDHLLLEDAYTPDEFIDFLHRDILEPKGIDQFQTRMREYSTGLWTPQILEVLDNLSSGTFFDLYAQLNERLDRLFHKENQAFLGGKEVLVEEYATPLINSGAKIVFVVRDPRAMITSLNFRQRDNLTGDMRPILYSLRVWRKSVALAISAERNGGGCMVRYEDLVCDRQYTLSKLTDFLDIEPYADNAFADGLVDQFGKPWGGNSSFSDRRGISHESLDVYMERLPMSVRHFIESVCAPEMHFLGYAGISSSQERDQALSDYRDPFDTIHQSFPSDYSHDEARLAVEKKRLQLLDERITDPSEQRKWFITPEAYEALLGATPDVSV
jgi:hypothetical protein